MEWVAIGYLMSYFKDNGEDGLHLAYSHDALVWQALNHDESLLRPEVGEAKLMRDPCLLRGPDGVFHLVWTTSWQGHTIGYSSSRDLRHWSPQRALPVMAHEPEALNCWAPELVYDEAVGEYVIFWSTTIPGRFPETDGLGDEQYNHRAYYTTTRDFAHFTPTRLLYDPGFNMIDGTLVRLGGQWIFILKDERPRPVRKNLCWTTAPSPQGPFGALSEPFTASWVEGPCALPQGDGVLIYFDRYAANGYGVVHTTDFKTFTDLSDRLQVPPGTRHATMLAVPETVLEPLL